MTEQSFYKWEDMPQTGMTPDIRMRLVSGEKVMSVQVTLDKGAVITTHQHPHEQISHILSGKLEFDLDGKKKVLEAGDVAHMPPNVPHTVVVLEDSVVIDIFSPPREDFLGTGTPDYMKK